MHHVTSSVFFCSVLLNWNAGLSESRANGSAAPPDFSRSVIKSIQNNIMPNTLIFHPFFLICRPSKGPDFATQFWNWSLCRQRSNIGQQLYPTPNFYMLWRNEIHVLLRSYLVLWSYLHVLLKCISLLWLYSLVCFFTQKTSCFFHQIQGFPIMEFSVKFLHDKIHCDSLNWGRDQVISAWNTKYRSFPIHAD